MLVYTCQSQSPSSFHHHHPPLLSQKFSAHGDVVSASESVSQSTEKEEYHINYKYEIELCGSSMSGWIWLNSSELQPYSTSPQHLLITDIGIHVFIPETFIKCPLCARHQFLISIFIRNLSFAAWLASSSTSTEYTIQISMPAGWNHWLVSRCSSSFAKSPFSFWESTDETRAIRKHPFFPAVSSLYPTKKVSARYVLVPNSTPCPPAVSQGVHAGWGRGPWLASIKTFMSVRPGRTSKGADDNLEHQPQLALLFGGEKKREEA